MDLTSLMALNLPHPIKPKNYEYLIKAAIQIPSYIIRSLPIPSSAALCVQPTASHQSTPTSRLHQNLSRQNQIFIEKNSINKVEVKIARETQTWPMKEEKPE